MSEKSTVSIATLFVVQDLALSILKNVSGNDIANSLNGETLTKEGLSLLLSSQINEHVGI